MRAYIVVKVEAASAIRSRTVRLNDRAYSMQYS